MGGGRLYFLQNNLMNGDQYIQVMKDNLYTNVRSLIPKRDELLAYTATKESDIIAITKTWVNSCCLMAEFSTACYKSFHKNRKYKIGGGVICYIKSTLSALKMDKQDAENYDSLYVEISTTKSNKIMIATIYRPPKGQAADDTALYEEIKSIIKNTQAVVIGDFNCPSIDWTSMTGDRGGKKLIEMVGDAFLTHIVTQMMQENNILDLVFASDLNLIHDCKVGEKLSDCDQNLIRFNIKTEYTLTDNKTKITDYRKANYNCASQLLPSATWNRLNLTDSDNAWRDFKNKLLEVERAKVPMKTRRVNGTLNPPWMTTDIKRAINWKKRNYNLMKQQPMAETSKHYHHNPRAC